MDLRHIAELSRRLVSKKPVLRFVIAVHVWLYRVSKGRIGGQMSNLPVLLLTTRGRKSGLRRTVPLCYLPLPAGPESETSYAIVGSYGGSPVAPAWYRNLQATPVAEVEIAERRISVFAREADAELSAQLWQDFCQRYPGYEVYQAATSRKIPIVVLQSY